MSPLAIRQCLFLLGCMTARLAIAWYASCASRKVLRVMGAAALAVAAGFGTIYALGLRKTGAEVLGDAIWWDALRPVHASLWFLFALYALRGQESAWVVLAADAVLGFLTFVNHHWIST